jgi:UMF1 family MFS transporter
VCVYGGALFTAALAFVGPGAYLLCSGLYIVANFCWSAANIFYDGFLPELTRDPKRMDALSGAGFATGYLGGGLMLALNLVIIALHDSLGLSKGGAVRVCFLLVAGWWALFTVPLLLFVPEKGGGQTRTSILGFVRAGVGRLVRTLGKIRQLPNLARFLLAFFLYYSGIGTIMIVAVGYGKDELGLTNETLVACVLMIQFVGLPATLAYVYLARKVGTRNSIFIGLAFYVAVVVYAMMITTVTEFWILGFLVALVQGGTQAMSRSLYGSLIPQGMSAEFFGFFSIFNKVGPFLGPIVFAVVKDVTQSGTGESSSRGAILFLAIFFVLGVLVLLTVKPERGREEARAFVAPHEE